MRTLMASTVLVGSLVTGGTTYVVVASSASAAGHASVTGIGRHHAFGTGSRGWGKDRPTRLFNGGDPSGLVTDIQWKSWGGAVAKGHGKNAIFKPGGGYYSQLVTIRLRAKDPGLCGSSGKVAYHRLYFRAPKKPGGPLGRQHLWAGRHDLCKPFN